MNDSAKPFLVGVITFGAALGAVVGISALNDAISGYKTSVDSVTVDRRFVCEDDGRLVEEHVMVESAGRREDRIWRIEYTDGQVAWYNQPAGETCFIIDDVPPATTIQVQP